ncbi:MAG: squalene/phytoene synthase family protein [Verrucomicrobiales bacterium]|nr:squalene/phytoene synthase family protein [Verrucomicrobiales bacterium]MCP5556339.1 squalene/phytoene synthase family protein [Verrucomicrobiaceae bacterium]
MRPSRESQHEKELGGQLLASVSRSFYLTLKALPTALREPISLAYLLARTADTIADTAAVPATDRLTLLAGYQSAIDHNSPAQAEPAMLDALRADFCPHQTDEAERRLLECTADGLAWLRTLDDDSRQSIREVLRHIIAGQTLDIQRFPSSQELRSLRTRDELDDYTWRVAGCVGQFWTQICSAQMPHAFLPGTDLQEQNELGIRLGKALQLINILRDLGEDLADGRCYLPESDWAPLGLDLQTLATRPESLRPIWEDCLKVCCHHLDAGLTYVQRIADGRLRYATALPLLLGAQTVTQMRQATWPQILASIKISRLDVASILAKAALACRNPEAIAALYGKLRG